MGNPVSTKKNIKRQTRGFLNQRSTLARCEDAGGVYQRLLEVGRVGLIGGAMRELHYGSARKFRSDLDFVLEVKNERAFERLLHGYKHTRNRFGGYRISTWSLDIDFWDVRTTWAHTTGLRNVSCLEDVVETTFFNVDALIYIDAENSLIAKDGALGAIEERFLDINLEENPNPLGAAVRALRRMHDHNMCVSDTLAAFISDQIDEFGWDRMSWQDRFAYPNRPVLQTLAMAIPRSGDEFRELIDEHSNRLPKIEQLKLPI
tara:strand:- start:97 stop:879 length:783 start_codon:yes stop_codon:yes gene_type:complete